MTPADYIGEPYEANTHDCWALCRRVSSEVYGRELPPFAGLCADSDDTEAAHLAIWKGLNERPQARGAWLRVTTGPVPSDLLLFRIGRWACHIGLFVGDNQFIHCLRGRETTIEPLRGTGWDERLQGVFRWSQG